MHALAGSPWTANTQENVKALLIHLELKIVFPLSLLMSEQTVYFHSGLFLKLQSECCIILG